MKARIGCPVRAFLLKFGLAVDTHVPKSTFPMAGLLPKIKSFFKNEKAVAAPAAPAAGKTVLPEIKLASRTINPTLETLLTVIERDSQAAFAELNKLKAQKKPCRDLDLLRACLFLRKEQPIAAIEALKEELRYFPDNEQARQALQRLAASTPEPPSEREAAFAELLAQIRPYTMVGEARLYSLYSLAKRVCLEKIPGNIVECGVAAGGSSALLAAVAQKHSATARKVFSFDTFEGMPAASSLDLHRGQQADETGWGAGTCAAPVESLTTIARKLGVADSIRPVKGLFADTLPKNREDIGPIALLHVDGDWYSSTMDVFENIYDQVVAGGFIQVDDYGFWEGCKRAVTEFQQQRGLQFDLQVIDDTGVWFQKK